LLGLALLASFVRTVVLLHAQPTSVSSVSSSMPSSPSDSPRSIEVGRSISAECGRSGRPPTVAGRSSSTHRSTEFCQSAAAESQPSGSALVSRGIGIVRPDTDLLGACEGPTRVTMAEWRAPLHHTVHPGIDFPSLKFGQIRSIAQEWVGRGRTVLRPVNSEHVF
jgi:hypothetical protein